MSSDSLWRDRSAPTRWLRNFAAAICLALAGDLGAQDVVGPADAPIRNTPSTSQPSQNSEIPPSLYSAPESNFHSMGGAANEVGSEPRRFHYALQFSFRGVYDDNINISQTNPISDYYFA